MKFLKSFLLAAVNLPSFVFAAWGYTDNGSAYVIDTGTALVFAVSKSNGDITSMKYNGVEYNGYGGKNSHVQSGLGASTVTIQQYTTPANIIKVTVVYGTLIQTYIARYGNANIYMLTNKGDASVPALRYIVRIPPGRLPRPLTDSDYYDPGSTIEASDISLSSANGYTKSKHYQGSNYGRTIDYDYVGKSTSSVGVWLIRSNREKASGGPFFRSLTRGCSPDAEDLYEILYYNMGTTDPERWGLQGPYVLSFTNGATPNTALFARKADWSWMDTLGIKGWVPNSGRGSVAGVGIANMKSGYTYVAALSNSNAQYWGTANPTTGAFSIAKILPGTYTLTIYKGELGVYTSSVTVTAGGKVALNTITPADVSDTVAIWRIGEWDGTPKGFTNFDKTPMLPTYMHPSDKRLASWNPPNYIVGTSTAVGSMPGYIWSDVNNGHLIYFKLSAAQTATAHTVRIGITQAYINGRPQIKINGWTSSIPSPSSQASTRSLTVGTYRGTNAIFTATSAFLAAGTFNVMTINVVSGSSGTGYLSAGISIDAIDFL
ncbi:rhamnogalacturonan lyase [Drepanopeziza brunnea f. sp. 'multigermtubi' MB_m1]|uniref:rhamnogalacturonan endolyase n=1 Tax=Marssonina brunnea f. sp. multigermtubi (strain MB_m1) TaxID=1072389 RepID=K1WV47_MARBU|nr:rhamnogalacturonan lyase [Drepanopeziza brunnea f. sp. 'multigermtubi' MB_m1]EKD21520.1 rhamnogalacturonan lyase [Drepanopeziza brunnea f. sp. 'multigermtubi' MB_m1]